MLRPTKCLLIVLLLLLTVQLKATPAGSYNIFYLNLSTGMPSNFVDDIYQDSDGFVWISTHNGGLLRYDGYSYASFGLNGNPMISLRSNFCHNVVEDHYHRLWAAFEEGVQAIDMTGGVEADLKATDDKVKKALDKAMNAACMSVYCDSKGCIWIIRFNEVVRIAFNADGTVSSVLTIEHNTKVPELGVADLDNDGSIYIGVNVRLTKISVKGNRLVATDLSKAYPQLTGTIIGSMVRWQGRTWFATNHGLYNSDRGNSGWHAGTPADALSHDVCTSLAVSADGKNLLIGTLCGVDVMDAGFHIVDRWTDKVAGGILSSPFVSIIRVLNGQTWIGTETGGVTQLVPRQLRVVNFVHDDANANTIAPGPVNSMYVAPNGDLWAGIVEGGLCLLRKGSNDFVHFTAANSSLPHNTVSVLTVDKSGNLWIGTWGGGVAEMPLQSAGDIRPLVAGDGYAIDLLFVGAMAYDPYNDGIWIGANAGLFFYDLRSHKVREPFPDCRNINGAIGSLVTRDGHLLMGCVPGMVSVDIKKGPDKRGIFSYKRYVKKLDHPSVGALDKLTCFCQARDGSLWIGSNGYGLYHVKGSLDDTLNIHNYISDDGLANNSIKGIVEDGHGMLWIATEHGLSRLNPAVGTFSNFTESDGLLSNQFYFNGAVKGTGDVIALGSDRGLTVLNGINASNVHRGHLRLTSLKIGSVFALPGSGYIDKEVGQASKITLHESDRDVRLEFSALNFTGNEQGAYAYRLKGYDDKWTPVPPGEHSASFSMLPAGSYTFEVRYSSPLGTESDETVAVDVVVRPYFWKSWWFITIVLVALAFAARWFYKRKLLRMREKEAEQLYRPLEAALKESDEPGELQERIKEILKRQENYRQSQRKNLEADRKEAAEAKSGEEAFADRLLKVMEKTYMNSELDVQTIAKALGMSRSELSKRIHEEWGLTTTQFVRDYRLDMARQILKDNVADRNITEIAYRVGFNDPKYFTRCFSQRFGVKPSQFKA